MFGCFVGDRECVYASETRDFALVHLLVISKIFLIILLKDMIQGR